MKDSSRSSVLAKVNATILRSHIVRFGDYKFVAPSFAVYVKEFLALEATLSTDVKEIHALKTSCDALKVRVPLLTILRSAYQSLVKYVASNFEYLHRNVFQKIAIDHIYPQRALD